MQYKEHSRVNPTASRLTMNANSLYPVVYDLSEAEYSSQNSTSSSRFCSGGGVDYSFQELLSQEPFPMSLYDVQLLGRDKPKRSGIRRSRSPSLQLTSAAKLTREDVDSRNDFDEPVADGRRIAFDDCFVLTRQVHKGVISVIWECVHRATGLRYAVKVVDRRRLNKRGEDAVYREVDMLGHIDSKTPGTIHLRQFFDEPTRVYIVTEYATGGSLLTRIRQKNGLPEEDTKNVIRSILESLTVQHRNGTVHRNLKPDNILLNGQSAMIADYGLATRLYDPATGRRILLTERCGTSAYVAPEILKKRPYDTQVDMWGVGIIAYMSLAGYPPFADEDKQALFSMISSASYTFDARDWAGISRLAKQFISSLLHVDPGVRMTAEEALEHPWLSSPLPPAPSIIEVVDSSVLNDATLPTKKCTAKKRLRVWSKFLGSKKNENGVDKIRDDGSTSTRNTSVMSFAADKF